MKLSLKTKLITMFFIFIAIPLITLGTVSISKTSQTMESVTEEELTELTLETSKVINQTIDSVDKYIQLLSHDLDITDFAAGNVRYKSEIVEYLSKLQKENSELIESIAITDATGRGIISTAEHDYNRDLSFREYMKKTLKGTPSISEVVASSTSNNNVIVIAHPLKKEEEIVGTVLGTIKFDNITKHAAEVKVLEHGHAYMIDKEGVFVYHHDEKKILKENLGDTDDPELKAIVEKMKSGKTDEGYYTYEGVYKHVRFTPVGNWVLALTANYDDYMAPAVRIRNNMIGITVISILISMLLAYFMATKNIVNPIRTLENLMSKVGEGDLTVRANINTKDEIQSLGEYFNEMVESQSKIINSVRMGSEELAASSEEVSASTEEISSSTDQIAMSINQVANDAENQNSSIVKASEVLVQLSSLVQIAQNKAIKAKENSNNTMDAAKLGRNKINGTVEAIENINKVSTETADILKVLDQLSIKVSGIIDTINSISSQTNLLALNAAIEAARAGEHGKGFTIVAEEVRKLSIETNEGANEISSLVEEMVVQINKAVESMESGKQVVEDGVIIANQTDEAFVSIINEVNQISKDINQIVDITKDEVASSDQIVGLIDTVATITETTTANSEEVAAAAEEQTSVVENLAASAEQTSAMANSLNSLVEKFKI